MLVHQLIFQGDQDSVAFHGATEVSYKKLQTQVVCFRNYLYNAGVRSGENVGVLLHNLPEFVYAYMAIASLGAVVVPINYQLTPQEVAFIVKDARIKNLVAAKKIELGAPLDGFGFTGSLVQHLIADIDACLAPVANIAPTLDDQISESQPCTIIYTSGTTGNPKGAVLTHNNLVSDAECFSKAMPVAENDNVLCILPLYHCLA